MTSVDDDLEHESWTYLGTLALSFSVDFQTNTHNARRLKAEVELVKRAVHEHLTKDISSRYLTAVFFVKLNKIIQKFDSEFAACHIENMDFLIFLKSLAAKIKRESIYVDKPFERVKEFRKLKLISENGNDFVRASTQD